MGLGWCGQGILLDLEDGLEVAVGSMNGSEHSCAGTEKIIIHANSFQRKAHFEM